MSPLPLDRPAQASVPDAALDDVREFLRDRVSSYEALEALIFLAQRPRRSFDAAAVSEGTRLSTLVALAALDELRRAGLVDEVREGRRITHVFWPATPELATAAARFLAVYEANPLDVIQIMSTNALDRVRSSAARAFAEAFVIRRSR